MQVVLEPNRHAHRKLQVYSLNWSTAIFGPGTRLFIKRNKVEIAEEDTSLGLVQNRTFSGKSTDDQRALTVQGSRRGGGGALVSFQLGLKIGKSESYFLLRI
jgi:hypothetical protein